MYGIVNKAIEELITFNYGEEKWLHIKKKSGIDVDFFLSNEAYDDNITYDLALTASNELNIPPENIFKLLGEWWVLKTGKEKYGTMIKAGGSTLKEFLMHLPDFHKRVFLLYPKLTPPEFIMSHVDDTSMQVHYYSKRQGLKYFVYGLLAGIGSLYNTPLDIQLLKDRESGFDHEIFKVSWK